MNPMQKKKLISIAIALTLQSYYIPAIAAENNDDEKECPSNISSLPKEKRAKLSPTCLATPENDNHWGWVAGGVAALVAGVAIGVENNGGGDSNHSYTPPTPDNGGDVTPPDDGGNVTPPDDGGNVTPPDDGGDDNVIPPDDSGDDDVTPPDDSGDDDVTPPDDSGDVWMAKKALLRPLGEFNAKPLYAQLEAELLEAVNNTGIGPLGMG
ncbi:fumarate hydratase, partial [Salmonella enterica subsp. enterica serovar Lubbock]|nr:fumarate hydratase [Salmonella enterica subsp. enterica serovar Lubbock]